MITVLADFDPGNIFQINQTTLLGRTDNNVLKILNLVNTSLRLQRIHHLLGSVSRHSADTAQRRLIVLPLNSGGNRRNRNIQSRNLIGIQPHTHTQPGRININLADTGHTAQTVFNVILHIVGQFIGRIGSVR